MGKLQGSSLTPQKLDLLDLAFICKLLELEEEGRREACLFICPSKS